MDALRATIVLYQIFMMHLLSFAFGSGIYKLNKMFIYGSGNKDNHDSKTKGGNGELWYRCKKNIITNEQQPSPEMELR